MLETLKEKKNSLIKLLSSDEIDRVNNYRLIKDKTNFILSRSILRSILSTYLPVQPQNIIFEYTSTLKPILRYQKNSSINFNVSHSNNLILYIVSRKFRVGIDCEFNKNISNFQSIVTRFFSSIDNTKINLLPQKTKLVEFFKVWTRKEAYLKATSKGLTGFNNPEMIDKKIKNWNIRTFCPKTGYIASIVYK